MAQDTKMHVAGCKAFEYKYTVQTNSIHYLDLEKLVQKYESM